MALHQAVAQTLDPSQFVIAPHVAALDEFKMSDPDGTFVADITPEYLTKFVKHMNEREALTGDLSPLVIGHTKSGEREIDSPPLVGFARNWHLGELGNTGRQCAFFDAWVYKNKVELVRQYPRRSCEVWASRYEADPISLLGATTPARDLGLMKLSRDGSFTYYPPGDMNMADEKYDGDGKTEKPKPDPKETGKAKAEDGKLDQILSLLTQLLDGLTGGGAPAQGQPPEAPEAPEGEGEGEEGEEGEKGGKMGDDEYEQLLQELMGHKQKEEQAGPGPEEPRKPEKPEEAPVKNQRADEGTLQKLAQLESQVSRMQVKESLVKLQREGKDVNPEDESLVADLAAMPDDMRNRQLDRMRQFNRSVPGAPSFHLDAALAAAQPSGTRGKRIQSAEEQKKLIQLARDKGLDFGAFLRSEGYDI